MTNLLFSLADLQFRLGGFLYSERQWSMISEQVLDPNVGVRSFAVDSRKLGPGDLFFPLAGERTDGHNFLIPAAKAGCRAMLVSRSYYQTQALEVKRLVEEFPVAVFPVTDVLGALHLLARLVIRRYSLKKIGVTGSNGKTTTKELIASILRQEAPCFLTPGNLNSVIGLPLAIPQIEERHRYGVFEMAMSEKGEMKRLADLIFPDFAVLTGIGTAHIGNIGSQMGIAQEKFDVFRNFQPDNVAVLPEGDSFVARLETKVRGSKVYFGPHETPGFQGVRTQGLGWQEFVWRGEAIRLQLGGEHNLMNALAAISLALVLGVDDESIRKGLSEYRPIFGRGELVEGPVNLLVDCYNANPDSMTAAIQSFMAHNSSGRKVLILGDMRELGRFSRKEHADIGRLILDHGPDLTILFGEEMEAAYEAAATTLGESELFWTKDWDELVEFVRSKIIESDSILLKASRSVSLERLQPIILTAVEVR